MTRVIVHAGFHKTGTTSLQTFLTGNRALLARYAAVYIGERLGEVRRKGRLYGERPFIWRRWRFRRKWREFLDSLPDTPAIFISRESFSGTMLGATRFGRPITRYGPMAIPLARELVAGLQRRFGAQAQIELLYTTRTRDSFLRSVWGHQLRTKRLTEDLPAFAAHFAGDFDLGAEACAIARAVAPVTVHIAALEDLATNPLGPGHMVLELLGVPAAEWPDFKPSADRHTGPSDALSQRFLALNRTQPAIPDLRRSKERLWHAERDGSGQ